MKRYKPQYEEYTNRIVLKEDNFGELVKFEEVAPVIDKLNETLIKVNTLRNMIINNNGIVLAETEDNLLKYIDRHIL